MTTKKPLYEALDAVDPSKGLSRIKGISAYNDAPDTTTKEDRYYLALDAADPSKGDQWRKGEKKLIDRGELSKPKIFEAEPESVKETHPVLTYVGFTIAGFFIFGILGLALAYLVSWWIRESLGLFDGPDILVFWIILIAGAVMGIGLGIMIASIALDRRKTHKKEKVKVKTEIVSPQDFFAQPTPRT